MEYCTGVERECPICKKIFIPTNEWAYRRKEIYFCSWKCLRVYESTHPLTGRNARVIITGTMKDEIYTKLRLGETCKQIAHEMDLSVSVIQKLRKTMKEEEL